MILKNKKELNQKYLQINTVEEAHLHIRVAHKFYFFQIESNLNTNSRYILQRKELNQSLKMRQNSQTSLNILSGIAMVLLTPVNCFFIQSSSEVSTRRLSMSYGAKSLCRIYKKK